MINVLTRAGLIAWICIFASFSLYPSSAAPRKRHKHSDLISKISRAGLDSIKAKSFLLVDAETGQVLYEKDADVMRPPASTTKIMTAILLIENTKPDDIIVASKAAQATKGSSLNLKWGEKISARDMLYGIMLRSANDGCVATAEHIAGSEAAFVELMNKKAMEIGATNTRFHNCNGLNDDIHLTTARDLALMARYASRYPEFNETTRTKWHTISRTSKSKDVQIQNHAKFLWRYPDADGIKTGWTVPAGKCFVGGATKNGWRLISVVLNSTDIVADTITLMNMGFENFNRTRLMSKNTRMKDLSVPNGVTPGVSVGPDKDVFAALPKDSPLQLSFRYDVPSLMAPLSINQQIGKYSILNNGRVIAAGTLVTLSSVNAKRETRTALKSPLMIFSLLVGVISITYGTTIAQSARRRRRRLETRMRANYRSGSDNG